MSSSPVVTCCIRLRLARHWLVQLSSFPTSSWHWHYILLRLVSNNLVWSLSDGAHSFICTGNVLASVFALSLATHVSLYPILLLPPLIILLQICRRSSTGRSLALSAVGSFTAHHSLILAASRVSTDSWKWLGGSWGVM